MKQQQAVIVAYGRSAYGKARKGGFADIHPVEYGAQVLKGVLNKLPQLPAEQIDDVIVGCALPYGVSSYNIAKVLVQRAQLPDSIPAMSINRFCASGMQAISLAANAIRAGEADVIVAGGVESMSMVSTALDPTTCDPWLMENRPGVYLPMGLTAENVAEQYGITRTEMDELAAQSHQKAAQAQAAGWFEDQIIPVEVCHADGRCEVVARDEGIRPGTTPETLANLKPAFKPDGSVTAGNSSQMTDGAGFVVVMSQEKAQRLGIRPLARIVGCVSAGVPAEIMGMGPTTAVPKLMQRTGMNLDQMDVIELNEAFASQTAACIRELKLDANKINPMGGAMALGHPLGASGTMLVCKALSWLERHQKQYALVTMCVGGGQGSAGIFERL